MGIKLRDIIRAGRFSTFFRISTPLLWLSLVSGLLADVDGAVFVPSRQNNRSLKPLSAATAAHAMNSVAFLRELLSFKDTADVMYYTQPTGLEGEGFSEPSQFMSRMTSLVRDVTRSYSTSCEYLGKLWFLRGKGIKFREQLTISDVSRDGTSACIECLTYYHNGKEWVGCSRVTCELSAVTPTSDGTEEDDGLSNDDGIEISVESNVLVRIPLPGIAGKAVRSKIGSSFESAAEAFLKKFAADYAESMALKEPPPQYVA